MRYASRSSGTSLAGVEPATSNPRAGGGRRTRDVRARGARFRRRRRARALREEHPGAQPVWNLVGFRRQRRHGERLEGDAAEPVRGGPTLGGGANASRGGGILRERAKLGRRRGTLSGGTLVGGRGVELGGDLKAEREDVRALPTLVGPVADVELPGVRRLTLDGGAGGGAPVAGADGVGGGDERVGRGVSLGSVSAELGGDRGDARGGVVGEGGDEIGERGVGAARVRGGAERRVRGPKRAAGGEIRVVGRGCRARRAVARPRGGDVVPVRAHHRRPLPSRTLFVRPAAPRPVHVVPGPGRSLTLVVRTEERPGRVCHRRDTSVDRAHTPDASATARGAMTMRVFPRHGRFFLVVATTTRIS